MRIEFNFQLSLHFARALVLFSLIRVLVLRKSLGDLWLWVPELKKSVQIICAFTLLSTIKVVISWLLALGYYHSLRLAGKSSLRHSFTVIHLLLRC